MSNDPNKITFTSTKYGHYFKIRVNYSGDIQDRDFILNGYDDLNRLKEFISRLIQLYYPHHTSSTTNNDLPVGTDIK